MIRLLLLCLTVSLSLAAPASTLWEVDQQQSSLTFIALQEGEEITGEFKAFDALLQFDPEDLANSRFDVTVDLNSLDSQSSDRDDTLRSADFFHIAHWPTATFATQSIKAIASNQYQAPSKLTIRDVSADIPFSFTLNIVEENGQQVFYAEGETTLERLIFGLGLGDWSDTAIIGAEVKVKTRIRAVAIPEN